MTAQAYHLKPVQWWEAKCYEVFDEVHGCRSGWADSLSIGIWLMCVKGRR